MNDAELAWVAGFLEGEGCFTVFRCNNKRYGLYQYPRIYCGSTDLDMVQRLKEYTGIGKIANPRQRGTDKTVWEWIVTRSQQAVELMETIYPFMGQRRRARITEVIDITGWKRMPHLGVRRLDTFSWVVGYLEGEGSFYWSTFQKGKYGPYYYPRVAVCCTDQDVIQWLPQYTGLGQITGPYPRKPPQKTVWYWNVSSRDDAVAFMEVVRPHMCSRRQARIAEVLDRCGRGRLRESPPGQLEFIDLVPIEEGKLLPQDGGFPPEGEPEAAGAARLYNQPLKTPIRPGRGRS